MDRLPLSDVLDKNPQQTTEPLPEKTWTGEMGPMDNLEYHRMADSLDISYDERKLPDVQEKLSYLSDWAKEQTKSEDRLTQQLELRALTKRLGIQRVGKELIVKLYQWCRLDQDRKRTEQKMELLHG